MFSTLAEIQELVDDRAEETISLDFKREPYPKADKKAKEELAKDVSAMANTRGGVILIGVAENKGKAHSIHAMNEESESFDQLKRRLIQSLEGGIEPRLTDISFSRISAGAGQYLAALRVGQSIAMPHRVLINHSNRYYYRNDGGTAEFTHDQLRSVFIEGQAVRSRIDAWRLERAMRIAIDEGPAPLPNGPKLLVHLVPLSSEDYRSDFPINSLLDGWQSLGIEGLGGLSYTANLHGVITYVNYDDGFVPFYCQQFRNGKLEFAEAVAPAEGKSLSSTLIAASVRSLLKIGDERLSTLGIEGPVYGFVSLVSVDGYVWPANSPMPRDKGPLRSSFSELLIPGVETEVGRSRESIDEIAQPILDRIWQAFMYNRCPLFDSEGKWKEDY